MIEPVIIGDCTLYHGDNRDVLRQLPDNSIDSVVTDPPYALVSIVKRFANSPRNERTENVANPYGRTGRGFMGCRWDTGEVAFSEEFWSEVLRVLKPGGHVAAFGASRGYHRMACAIEDAGFEIRDSLMWVYGTGFPKSQNVAKFIDQHLGAERTKIRVDASEVRNPKATGGGRDGMEGATRPWIEAALECGYHEKDSDDAVTPEAQAYHGFGTALKPAFEPIVLARKPLSEGTVAANVLRWGTGALNIDGCRVASSEPLVRAAIQRNDNDVYGKGLGAGTQVEPQGRWPANVVHDGSDDVVGAFPSAGGQQGRAKIGGAKGGSIYGKFAENVTANPEPRGDSGSAARFFYSAKASKKDRDEGLDSLPPPAAGVGAMRDGGRESMPRKNTHPTVKPTALMQWLCRLITPPGGTVLDPFMGSGSTGKAAVWEGFKFIGCEREDEYIKIAEARIAYAVNNPPTVAAPIVAAAVAAQQPANDNEPAQQVDLFAA